jgi:hypothetical protein
MNAYYVEIRKLECHFEGIEFLVPAGVFIQDLRKPSIKQLDMDNPDLVQPDQTPAPPHDVLMIETKDDWREPFLAFLLDQRVPKDKARSERITS